MKLRDATMRDLAAIEALLQGCELPAAGVAEHVGNFVVVDAPEGGLVACAGLEYYGDSALLRSVAVAQSVRSGGMAASMVRRLLEDCRACGIRCVALLTVSAQRYFERQGFSKVERGAIPPQLLESSQFQGVCPASATVMLRQL